MIPETKERIVLDLLGRGLSERKIAARGQVARGTVRSRKFGYRSRRTRPSDNQPAAQTAPRDDRCPTCHAKLTVIPCIACAVCRQR